MGKRQTLKSLEEKVKITGQNDKESKCQKSKTISKMVGICQEIK